jgi:CysZ protein
MDGPLELTHESLARLGALVSLAPTKLDLLMLFAFLSVFRAIGHLLRTPRSWPLAAIPAVLLVLLSAGALWGIVGWVEPWLRALLGTPEGAELSLRQASGTVLSWLATALLAVLGVLLAMIVTPPLSAPALEGLVTLREHELGVAPRRPRSVWFELACGLRAQALGLAVFGPILVLGWLANLVLPVAAVFVAPLTWLCGVLVVAWNLFDYPLTLRGVGARKRLAFLRRHASAWLGFGAACALMFWVPCFGVLLLPIGVTAATEVVWQLAAQDAQAPEELRAAAPGAFGEAPTGQPRNRG